MICRSPVSGYWPRALSLDNGSMGSAYRIEPEIATSKLGVAIRARRVDGELVLGARQWLVFPASDHAHQALSTALARS